MKDSWDECRGSSWTDGYLVPFVLLSCPHHTQKRKQNPILHCSLCQHGCHSACMMHSLHFSFLLEHTYIYSETVTHTVTHVRTCSHSCFTLSFSCFPCQQPSLLSVSQIEKGKIKHLCMFLLQVIHLWFEEFALEATDLCTGDAVTLQDSLGSIGKSFINSH